MIAAIMQPYFFPYIGYFQLMQAVDVFVFFDDVQYINRGWVNRNRVLLSGKPAWLTLPVEGGSRNLPINMRHYLLDSGVESTRRRLRAAYPRMIGSIEFGFIDELLKYSNPNVAAFNVNLLRRLAEFLEIKCEFRLASEIADLSGIHGEDRVIELCRRLEVDEYVNPIGGVKLYSQAKFSRNHIKLSFLTTEAQPCVLDGQQLHLSILHWMATFRMDETREALHKYSLES